MPDTSRIHQLVAQARRRLRFQSALEVATFALIPAAVVCAAVVFSVRQYWLPSSLGLGIAAGAGGLALLATVIAYFKRFPTQVVATRIDRASRLSDRLATACAFEQTLADKNVVLEPETRTLMELAVEDGLKAAPNANIVLATPYRRPAELPAACAFVVIAALVSFFVHPSFGLIGLDPQAVIAENAARNAVNPKDSVEFEDDDLDYTRALVDDMMKTAKETDDKHLEDYAKELKELLEKANDGELSKQELLEKLAKADKKYNEGTDEDIDATMKELKKTGKELKKENETKALGKALEKGDLEQAQKEMEKLAQKLDENKLTEKQQQKIAKAMEKAAEKFEKRDANEQKAREENSQKTQKQIKQLEKKMAGAKNEREKSRISRQLEQKKRQLKKLERKKQQQQKSASRRELKQLHRNMKQAAKQMQQKDKNQQSRRQASKRMRDMQRNTGKVSKDQRKMANKKRMASQMRDLKDAMRRAKRKGSRGPQDRFGRNKRNRDFGNRARGGKGNREGWKPGQNGKGGKGKGKNGMGKNGQKPGGKGKQPGGKQWGDGTAPDLLGDATRKGGDVKDESVQGIHGKGPSTRETILSAAEKGFSARSYEDVYVRYKTIVEEVINAEKVPAGYKYYVKKYFEKIKPQ